MAPIVSPAQHLANYERYMTFSLQEATFEKRRGNGGSSDEVEERDLSLKHLSTLSDPASQRSSGHSDTSPSHSKLEPAPMSQAKAASKPVKAATPTHKTAPKTTPHPLSSSKAAPKQSPRTSIQQNPSPTTMTETAKPIPIALSLPRSSSIHSPSLSPPPSHRHSLSPRNEALAAGLGSAAAILLVIGLFYFLRLYCRQGRSTKLSDQIRQQRKKDEEAHPAKKHIIFMRKRKREELHPRKRQQVEAREAMMGGVIEMVRPAQATQRRDFGSQFSPSLESQLQRADTQVQEAGGSDLELQLQRVNTQVQETVETEDEVEEDGQSLQPPLAPQRTISDFALPSPVVGVAETAAAFQSGNATIVYLMPSSDDGEDLGRVVSLGDSCVIEMMVRVMNDDDEERRGDDGDRVGTVEETREIDDVVVTVTDLGTRVVEEGEDESGGEGRVEGGFRWHRRNGDLSGNVEDAPLDGQGLDSEDERDYFSFKSTRGSIEAGEPEEGGKSGDDVQTEGAGRDVGAAGGFENTGWEGTASAERKGGDSGYEDDADSYGGDEEDDAYSNPWDR